MNEIMAMEQIGFPILSVLLFLPVVFMVALAFVKNERLAYRIGLAGAALTFIVAAFLAYSFRIGTSDMQFVERLGPLPGIGVGYHLGVDGVSILFIPVTALLALLVVLYAEYSVQADARHYLMATLGLEATMLGAFLSLDLVLFWAFFVLELVPAYFLITRWGTGERRREAAFSYIYFMLTGAALMLVGMVLLAVNHSMVAGSGLSFDFVALLDVPVPEGLQTVIFFLLFIGFAVKAPLFPLHTWMPKVLEEGPVVGMSVFLVGIKLGTYGMLRFIIPLLPEAAREWLWLMAVLGVVSIVYGAMIALIQTNLRRLLAFASVSHMGVVVLSIFTLNIYGLEGGLLQMINFGVAGAGLFFVAGFINTRVGPPVLSSLGGVSTNAPWLTVAFLVIALATVGLPGTGGFNGEHLVLIGAFEVHWALSIAAGSAIFLTAAYFLWYFQRAFLGDVNERTVHKMKDLRFREMVITLSLGAVIFWIGLATTPFVERMRPSLEALETRAGVSSPGGFDEIGEGQSFEASIARVNESPSAGAEGESPEPPTDARLENREPGKTRERNLRRRSLHRVRRKHVERESESIEKERSVNTGSGKTLASGVGNREKPGGETLPVEASLRVHREFVEREGEAVERERLVNDATPVFVRAAREPSIRVRKNSGGEAPAAIEASLRVHPVSIGRGVENAERERVGNDSTPDSARAVRGKSGGEASAAIDSVRVHPSFVGRGSASVGDGRVENDPTSHSPFPIPELSDRRERP